MGLRNASQQRDTLEPIAYVAGAIVSALILIVSVAAARADLPAEKQSIVTLPAKPSAHWVFANDFAFQNMMDSRAYLIDADAGQVLGLIPTGYFHNALKFPADYREIYSVQTYYSRGSRGDRTDVVSIYNPEDLSFSEEIVIPAKRMTNTPSLANSVLTGDGRFLVIFNMTPAWSATVVDVTDRRVVGEFDTGGCAMLYPSGPRRLHLLCGDGGLMTVTLDASGAEAGRARIENFFDASGDPVLDRAVNIGETWFFISARGVLHPLDASQAIPVAGERWSLVSDADRAASWWIGGSQPLAVHPPTNTLYALMHQGGPHSHDDPGSEIWTYDLSTRERTGRFILRQATTTMTVTPDAAPLLLGASFITAEVDVYDAKSGTHLRTVGEVGTTPFLLQVPPQP